MKYCPKCDTRLDDGQPCCPECGGNLALVEEDNLPGQTLDGKYLVKDRIGEGGMGAVYKAIQTNLERTVAVKVLRKELSSDSLLVQRFFNEARAVARLRSPHTIRIFDFAITAKGLLYFSMDFLEGQSLRALLNQEGELPIARAADILYQACQSLHEAHEAGILHRDLKPENLFVTRDMHGRDFVTVLDFGIAKRLDSDEKITQTGQICGTPAYISPEVLLGKTVDRRTDIYALGIMLHEMITGETPFTGDTPTVILMQHVSRDPEPVRERYPRLNTPEVVDRLIQDALAKDPGQRPADAAVFAQRLLEIKALAEGRAPDAVRQVALSGLGSTVVDRSPESARSGRLLAMAAAAVLVIMALGVALFWPNAEAPSPAPAPAATGAPGATPTPRVPTTPPGPEVVAETATAVTATPEVRPATPSEVTSGAAAAEAGPEVQAPAGPSAPTGGPVETRGAGGDRRTTARGQVQPKEPAQPREPARSKEAASEAGGAPSPAQPASLFRQERVKTERELKMDLFKPTPVDQGPGQ